MEDDGGGKAGDDSFEEEEIDPDLRSLAGDSCSDRLWLTVLDVFELDLTGMFVPESWGSLIFCTEERRPFKSLLCSLSPP
jgi:hypothetical protein